MTTPWTRIRALAEDEAVPAQVRDAVRKELARLERTSEQSPEHGWIRTWLDTVADLPWTVRAEDALDLPGPGRCSTPTTTGSTT